MNMNVLNIQEQMYSKLISCNMISYKDVFIPFFLILNSYLASLFILCLDYCFKCYRTVLYFELSIQYYTGIDYV